MELLPALLFLMQSMTSEPGVASNPYTTADDVAMGKKLYDGRCAGCHGPSGDGGKGANLASPVLPRGQNDVALYRTIRFGIPESEMPGHNMTPREIWQMAAYVRALGVVGTEKITGDPARGEAIARNKGACLQCHLMNGEGGNLGPALTDIGRRRSAAYLRLKLTDPARDLSGNFSQAKLKARSGQTLQGVVLNEDTWSIQVRDTKGRVHSFWKEDLAELKVERQTLMPAYAERLSPSELDDVVAFLATTGSRR